MKKKYNQLSYSIYSYTKQNTPSAQGKCVPVFSQIL